MNKLDTLELRLKYISEREGCELGDAADGLLVWLEYGSNDDALIEALSPTVEEYYEDLKEEYRVQAEFNQTLRTTKVSDLPNLCLFRVLNTNVTLTKACGHIFLDGEDVKLNGNIVCEIIKVYE